jgi:hypothetical protein
MPKDPAALFFIEKWLVATKEMKADCRGWFLNLVLHQFDKKDLPNDVEELANLADVRFSEYEEFKQTWQHVLQQKFQLNNNGRLENAFATEIIRSREQFKDKRSEAGRMSVFIKYVRANLCQDENVIFFVKKHADLTHVDINNQHMLQQVFQQMHQLYINTIKNKNTNTDSKEEGLGETIPAGIVPEMLQEFQKSNPEYPYDQQKDFPALRSVADQIKKYQKLSGDITAPKNADSIKRRWGELLPFIRAHTLFGGYSLAQVDKHFQSIVQSFNKTKNGPHPKTSRTAPVIQNVPEGGFGQL